MRSGRLVGTRKVYDLLKRLMDIVIASIVGIISLILYPFVYLAIKTDDGGSVFIFQERIGKNGNEGCGTVSARCSQAVLAGFSRLEDVVRPLL